MQVGRGAAIIIATVSFLAWNSPAPAVERSDFVGIWMSDKDDGAMELRPCGEMLCGYIYSIVKVPDPSLPLRDNRNENPALRKRPLCGLQTLGALKKVSDDAWGDGWVYDPERGKSYSVEVTLKDSATLAVRGYVGTKIMGQTRLFSRARSAPQKCAPPKDA